MKTYAATILAGCGFLLALCSNYATAQTDFDSLFERKSLRLDFALSGDAGGHAAALEQLREEPLWSGPVKNLIDHFNYGGYYVKVYDENQQLIYSRGFNTLFEEWLTTTQAEEEVQSWTNSVVIPFPKKIITVELLTRDRESGQFSILWRQDVDPNSLYIDRSPLNAVRTEVIQDKGEPAQKVDLVFLAEGYTDAEIDKFLDDSKRFADALFQTPPYNQRQEDFNIRAVCLPSAESGTDIPGKGVYKNTALNSGFYTFGIERYLTTRDMNAIRNAVWNVPCDAIFILVNSAIYGGGGMYNFYAMGTADNERTIRVFVHELGHSFAGLADEYYESDVAYNDFYHLDIEPWEPNITTLVDFDSKWKNKLEENTPIPTPLNNTYKNKTGVFEGAGYVPKGVYRPADHCMMRDMAPFCPVCSDAILKMIDFITDK